MNIRMLTLKMWVPHVTAGSPLPPVRVSGFARVDGIPYGFATTIASGKDLPDAVAKALAYKARVAPDEIKECLAKRPL
jgi:hypothetical protein